MKKLNCNYLILNSRKFNIGLSNLVILSLSFPTKNGKRERPKVKAKDEAEDERVAPENEPIFSRPRIFEQLSRSDKWVS